METAGRKGADGVFHGEVPTGPHRDTPASLLQCLQNFCWELFARNTISPVAHGPSRMQKEGMAG